jgi:ATP-dependent helicase HrpB
MISAMASSAPLPIDAILPELRATLRERESVVIRAGTGAGKSTHVPAALLGEPWLGDREVLVLQPRRLAARAVARRIAEERGSRLGGEVGYQVRFDSQASRETRLLVVTEGILIRRLLADPFLESVGAVVLDEFHERHLETDLALAMCRRVQQTVRPDLRLVVMSATLAAEDVSAYLDNCPILGCDPPQYPVEIRHIEIAGHASPTDMAAAIRRLSGSVEGNILGFLPGVREIQRTAAELAGSSFEVLPLYGELPTAAQDRVFQPSESQRVILATNVAETSLTIPGIAAVVDSGLARIREYDARTGLNRLVTKAISGAAAAQRSGRAGRLGPGICLRLWSLPSEAARPAFETPEIHRLELAGTLLQLATWGETDWQSFPWFETPRSEAVQQAYAVLERLGAWSSDSLTPFGRQLARWPLEPRLAALVEYGCEHGAFEASAWAAILLSERSPFPRESDYTRAGGVSMSDIWDRVLAIRAFQATGNPQSAFGPLDPNAIATGERMVKQFRRIAGSAGEQPNGPHAAEVVARGVFQAFSDRLARRRPNDPTRGVMIGGRGIQLARSSAVTDSDLFVCLNVDDAGSEALVRMASAVERDWLTPDRLETRNELEVDEQSERIQARRRVYWDGLLLEDSPTSPPNDEAGRQAMLDLARRHWPKPFPAENPDVIGFLARLRLARKLIPDVDWPDWNDDSLKDVLDDVLWGCRTFEEIRRAPWMDVLRGRLTPEQRQILDREIPERIAVPSGSQIRIDYAVEGPPVLAVRIQEVFGWRATPRIARGQIPLLLHLLGPNHRPQQITDDLESFWKNGYPVVRGELRRRYPKHSWPDDPWTAEAQHGPKRRT